MHKTINVTASTRLEMVISDDVSKSGDRSTTITIDSDDNSLNSTMHNGEDYSRVGILLYIHVMINGLAGAIRILQDKGWETKENVYKHFIEDVNCRLEATAEVVSKTVKTAKPGAN